MFIVGDADYETNIVLHNQGTEDVAFRIQLNKKKLFYPMLVVGGVLIGNEYRSLTVRMRTIPPGTNMESFVDAKFKVELTRPGDEYSVLESKDFWKLRKDEIIERQILAVFDQY